jgi:hypothetical protein
LTDAWLSGFIDAEGCFNIVVVRRKDTKFLKPTYRIRLRFTLDQKNDKILLESIRNLIGYGYVNLRSGTVNVFRYTLDSILSLLKLIKYLEFYRLKTKKLNSFDKWLIVYFMVLKKEHLTDAGLIKIYSLKKEVNQENSLLKRIGLSLNRSK